jgi:hypothetical protein
MRPDQYLLKYSRQPPLFFGVAPTGSITLLQSTQWRLPHFPRELRTPAIT